jgi:hypothetical protein
MRKLSVIAAVVAVLMVASVAQATPGVWETKAGLGAGDDLVSDATNLYKVGGDGDADGLYVYDGPALDSWTQLPDNPQVYSHKSPGEGNRTWLHEGRIFVVATSHRGHPGGNKVTSYNIGTQVWTDHGLPEFVVGEFCWSQGAALNAYTNELYLRWTETVGGSWTPAVITHAYAAAILENTDADPPNWIAGSPWDEAGPIGSAQGFVIETNSTTAFDFNAQMIGGEWRGIAVNLYDYATQPADFSGTWTTSSVYDVGGGNNVLGTGASGTDVMDWDPVTQRLYVVAPGNGQTLSYDPATDTWTDLGANYTGGHWFNDYSVAVADGWIYAEGGAVMGAFEIVTAVPGDVDGNGVVNGLDLTAVLTAWDTIPGDALWNVDADLDGNNVINGLDLTEVISNWTVASAAGASEAVTSDATTKRGPGNVNKGKGKVRKK